jgi:hypothetical protein
VCVCVSAVVCSARCHKSVPLNYSGVRFERDGTTIHFVGYHLFRKVRVADLVK